MHVVFTTRDSLFEQWLVNKHGSYIFVSPLTARKTPDIGLPATHYKTVVLGDLTKKEVYDYFCHKVDALSVEEQDLFRVDKENFEHVYHLTGGNMLFINDYI